MNTRHLGQIAIAGLLAIAMASPVMASNRRTSNTIVGAGLGAVAGAILSNGDPIPTLGAAAAGGLLGNVLTSGHRSHERVYYPSYHRPHGHYVQERYSHYYHGNDHYYHHR